MSGVSTVRPSGPSRGRSLAFKINMALFVAVITAAAIAIIALVSMSSMASHAKAAEKAVGSGSTAAHSDVASILNDQSDAATWVLVVLFVGVAIALIAGWRAARNIRTNLSAVAAVAEGLAAGDLTRSARIDTDDEIGRLADALDRASAQLREDFASVGSNAGTLASASVELTSAATALANSAEAASTQAEASADAAGAVTSHVQAVATGGQEMGSSIREISVNASEATRVAAQAVTVAASTNDMVTRLGESSS